MPRLLNKKHVASTGNNSLIQHYDIILHIGAPKTGSSALQKFLLQNRKLLSKYGLFYPEHELDKNGISGGHSKLAISLIGKKKEEANSLFRNWYQKSRKDNKTLLLSSESFFNISGYLQQFLANKKVLVIAYYRSPLDYVISVHNQLVKRHYETRTLRNYVSKLLELPQGTANLINKPWHTIYQEWEKLVGNENLRVRYYNEKHFYDNKIELDFIHQLGLDTGPFKTDKKRINTSYCDDALELKRMMNNVLEKDNALNHKIDLLLQKYSDQHPGSCKRDGCPLDSALIQSLSSHFKLTEKIVHDKYLGFEPDSSIRYVKSAEKAQLSLGEVAKHLMRNSDIKHYLRAQTIITLNSGFMNYSIFKFAELLEIEGLEEFEQEDLWFTERQISRMPKYNLVEFLRDTSLLLYKRKDFVNAEKLINKALKIRPRGPAIIKLKKDITCQLKK